MPKMATYVVSCEIKRGTSHHFLRRDLQKMNKTITCNKGVSLT